MIAGRIASLAARLRAAGIEAARSEAWLLLAAATGRPRGALMAAALEGLSTAEEHRLEAMVRRRAAREPMAYVLGEKEFWSLAFTVGPAVLIPRPESETVVEAAPDRRAPAPDAAMTRGSSISAPGRAACCWRCWRSCRGRAGSGSTSARRRSRWRRAMPGGSGWPRASSFVRGEAGVRRSEAASI